MGTLTVAEPGNKGAGGKKKKREKGITNQDRSTGGEGGQVGDGNKNLKAEH